MNFIEKVLAGEEFSDAIDDYIDKWHESDTSEPLHAFLGFTHNEYGLWVENPITLEWILLAKKHRHDFDEPTWNKTHLLAARSGGNQSEEIILEWLKSKGKI